MVYVAIKRISNHEYFYLQKSIYDKKTKTRTTKCIGYLGPKEGMSSAKLKREVSALLKKKRLNCKVTIKV